VKLKKIAKNAFLALKKLAGTWIAAGKYLAVLIDCQVKAAIKSVYG
jgi:hypothetical protein